MKYLVAVLVAIFLISPVHAKGKQYSKSEVKAAESKVKQVTGLKGSLTSGSGPHGTCLDDSECRGNWICVGMGLCVPPATQKEFKKDLPKLLGPRR